MKMKKAIGIQLQGDKPTAEERERLEARAKAEIGEGKYKVTLVRYYDALNKKSGVRLDAIEL